VVREIEGFGGEVVDFTKMCDCGVNVFKLLEPELLDAMKEGKSELKEGLRIWRGVIHEEFNAFVEVLSSI
jgi:hypothetical protein